MIQTRRYVESDSQKLADAGDLELASVKLARVNDLCAYRLGLDAGVFDDETRGQKRTTKGLNSTTRSPNVWPTSWTMLCKVQAARGEVSRSSSFH